MSYPKKGSLLKFFFIVHCSLFIVHLPSQDFGFGFDDEDGAGSRSAVSVNVGGEIAVEVAPYVHDFADKAEYQEIDLSGVKFNFALSSPYVEFIANFNINAGSVGELWSASPDLKEFNHTPLIIDEAYVRGFAGPVNITLGYRKLTWGRADSLGPLDVTNPMDLSDLRGITDIKEMKIARPMLHVAWNTGDFSKLEAVFIPNFAADRFAREGRWAPLQFTTAAETAGAGILTRARQNYPPNDLVNSMILLGLALQIPAYASNFAFELPSTGGIEYFQAGLRFTTTVGPADIGGQYFYGNLFRPGFTVSGVDNFINDLFTTIKQGNQFYQGNPALLSPSIEYSRFHQIGVDYAQVLFGFNLRSELAINLTKDLSGDDGAVRNPFIGWSLGFDRDVVWGINANVQCNQTIRLLNSKVGDNPVLDSEAGTNVTSTRLTMQLSRNFFRDNLETKATVIWDIEDSGCYIIPSLVWNRGDLAAELSAGIFAGKEKSELGQYWENSFIKLGLTYTF